MVETAKSVTLMMQKLLLNIILGQSITITVFFMEQLFPNSETRTQKITGRICKYLF